MFDIPEDIDTGVNRRDLNTTTPILRRSTRTLERENQGIATRTRSRVNFDTTLRDHQSVNLIMESDIWDTDLTLESHKEYIFNVMLQSDPGLGVPKNYKDLLKTNDPDWIRSLNNELDNFLKRDAWEFISRNQLPHDRKTLRCKWIIKQKVDGTKKSQTVVRGYEQEPGIDFVESFSPLSTNTTIRVVLAIALEMRDYNDDWKIHMVDVEAAFLNAKVDTDVYIEMPEGLKEYLDSLNKSVEDSVIKLKRAQYGLVQSPRLWMETFSRILVDLGLIQCKSGAIFMAKNTAIGQRTKHVDIRYRFINDMVQQGDLSVVHISGDENPSDVMTKNLPYALHAKHNSTIVNGTLGKFYDPRNTEDVKPSRATVVSADTTSRVVCPLVHYSQRSDQ